jgi:hypothetical protein
VQEYVGEVVVVLLGRASAHSDALREQVAREPGEAGAHAHGRAVGQPPLKPLPREVSRDVAGAAEVRGREPPAAARADALAVAVALEIAEELDLDGRAVDHPSPAPSVLAGVGLEVETFEGAFDRSEVALGVDLRDQEHVDIRGPEVLRNFGIDAGCQHLRHETAEDDQERVVVAQLMHEPDKCGLSSCPRLP